MVLIISIQKAKTNAKTDAQRQINTAVCFSHFLKTPKSETIAPATARGIAIEKNARAIALKL